MSYKSGAQITISLFPHPFFFKCIFRINTIIIQARYKYIMTAETVSLLIERAIFCETLSRDFYQGLAKKFYHETNISGFWKNMAEDEIEHIKILEDLRGLLTPLQLSVPVEHEIFQIALENSRVQINDLLNMVKNLNDAYILAQLWENSEIYRVFEFLTETLLPNEVDGRFIRLHIITHKKKLVTFTYAFGDADVRKNIRGIDEE
jgi:hypothetical protein